MIWRIFGENEEEKNWATYFQCRNSYEQSITYLSSHVEENNMYMYKESTLCLIFKECKRQKAFKLSEILFKKFFWDNC